MSRREKSGAPIRKFRFLPAVLKMETFIYLISGAFKLAFWQGKYILLKIVRKSCEIRQEAYISKLYLLFSDIGVKIPNIKIIPHFLCNMHKKCAVFSTSEKSRRVSDDGCTRGIFAARRTYKQWRVPAYWTFTNEGRHPLVPSALFVCRHA